MTNRQKKVERRAARLDATLLNAKKNKMINKLVRANEDRPALPPEVIAKIKKKVGVDNKLPDLSPDVLRKIAGYLVDDDDNFRDDAERNIDELERNKRNLIRILEKATSDITPGSIADLHRIISYEDAIATLNETIEAFQKEMEDYKKVAPEESLLQ